MNTSRSKPAPPPPDKRLQQFFRFALELESHPFFKAHAGGARFTLNTRFPEDTADTAYVNFDEIHLESLLTRLRQFVSANELFYFKDLRRATIDAFGEDPEFQRFYDQLVTVINRPFPKRTFEVFKANGKDVVAGFTFKDLMEAQLYTGAIHSDRLVNPTPGSAEEGLADAHVAAKKQLVLDLGYAAMKGVENVFAFRSWILKMARAKSRTDLFLELQQFDERCRAAGL